MDESQQTNTLIIKLLTELQLALTRDGRDQPVLDDAIALIIQQQTEIEQLKLAMRKSCAEERSLATSEGGSHAVCGLVDELQREIERLKDVLHRDQTGLANALNRVRTHINGWSWIAQKEWGLYGGDEQSVETLQFEVKNLIDGGIKIIDDSLYASGKLAHAECCGRKS